MPVQYGVAEAKAPRLRLDLRPRLQALHSNGAIVPGGWESRYEGKFHGRAGSLASGSTDANEAADAGQPIPARLGRVITRVIVVFPPGCPAGPCTGSTGAVTGS